MFSDCVNLTEIGYDFNRFFDTVAVNNFAYMCYDCSKLESFNLNRDTYPVDAYASIANARYMFANCPSLTDVVFLNFYIVSAYATTPAYENMFAFSLATSRSCS